jgi:hypothetical protein
MALSDTSNNVTDGASACPCPLKRIAILQSNYIPWKGYFDIINSVDEFVIYDEAQYTRRDWRNRNLIKTKHGLKWMTVPVIAKGRFEWKINETEIFQKSWAEKHWKTIKNNYSAAPHFFEYQKLFEAAYIKAGNMTKLSEVNFFFIELINKILGINTRISQSSEYRLSGTKTEKLVSVCKETGAQNYYSGPAAKGYIDERLFNEAGISLTWMDYNNYMEYAQLNPPFVHKVSLVDLIFNYSCVLWCRDSY